MILFKEIKRTIAFVDVNCILEIVLLHDIVGRVNVRTL